MKQKEFYQVKKEYFLRVWNPENGQYEDVPGARGYFYKNHGNCLVIGKNWFDCKRFMVDRKNQRLWQVADGYKNYDIEDDYALFRKGWDWFIQLTGSDKVVKLFSFGGVFGYASFIKKLGNREKLILNFDLKQKEWLAVFDMESKRLEYLKEVTVSEENLYRVKDKWYRYRGATQEDELFGTEYAEYGISFYAYFADGDYHIRFRNNLDQVFTCKEFEIWNSDTLICLREDGLYDIYDGTEKLHCSGRDDLENYYWCGWDDENGIADKYRWNFVKDGYEQAYSGRDDGYYFNAVLEPLEKGRVRLLNLDDGGKVVCEGELLQNNSVLQIDQEFWRTADADDCYLDWVSQKTVVFKTSQEAAVPVKIEETASFSGGWKVIVSWLQNFWR